MQPIDIIDRFYPRPRQARAILLTHGRQVADKALAAARRLPPHHHLDLAFIEEAALLHDIGMVRTQVPELDCHGAAPYIQHGIIGRKMLESVGLPDHGRVCERHVGVGITAADIRHQGLPLPLRDMRPVTMAEEIICWADKYFSKSPDGAPSPEKRTADIMNTLRRWGGDMADRFAAWEARFNGN